MVPREAGPDFVLQEKIGTLGQKQTDFFIYSALRHDNLQGAVAKQQRIENRNSLFCLN